MICEDLTQQATTTTDIERNNVKNEEKIDKISATRDKDKQGDLCLEMATTGGCDREPRRPLEEELNYHRVKKQLCLSQYVNVERASASASVVDCNSETTDNKQDNNDDIHTNKYHHHHDTITSREKIDQEINPSPQDDADNYYDDINRRPMKFTLASSSGDKDNQSRFIISKCQENNNNINDNTIDSNQIMKLPNSKDNSTISISSSSSDQAATTTATVISTKQRHPNSMDSNNPTKLIKCVQKDLVSDRIKRMEKMLASVQPNKQAVVVDRDEEVIKTNSDNDEMLPTKMRAVNKRDKYTINVSPQKTQSMLSLNVREEMQLTKEEEHLLGIDDPIKMKQILLDNDCSLHLIGSTVSPTLDYRQGRRRSRSFSQLSSYSNSSTTTESINSTFVDNCSQSNNTKSVTTHKNSQPNQPPVQTKCSVNIMDKCEKLIGKINQEAAVTNNHNQKTLHTTTTLANGASKSTMSKVEQLKIDLAEAAKKPIVIHSPQKLKVANNHVQVMASHLPVSSQANNKLTNLSNGNSKVSELAKVLTTPTKGDHATTITTTTKTASTTTQKTNSKNSKQPNNNAVIGASIVSAFIQNNIHLRHDEKKNSHSALEKQQAKQHIVNKLDSILNTKQPAVKENNLLQQSKQQQVAGKDVSMRAKNKSASTKLIELFEIKSISNNNKPDIGTQQKQQDITKSVSVLPPKTINLATSNDEITDCSQLQAPSIL